MRKILFAFLTLIIISNINAQSKKINFVEYDLSNGLHVILHEDHTTPIVAVSVMYHVGSKNEKPDRTGFAHFFEHLMFEGSKYVKRGEYDRYLQNVGGMNNANTTQDRTFYYEVLPSNNIELALWLESERMLHAKVDSVGIETQREVVKEEKRQRIDNRPYGTIWKEAFGHAYKVHPYKWPVIGSMDDLNAATEKDYKDFYNTFYVPNNAILSIAGDINISETMKMITKYFSPIPKGTKEIYRPHVVEPPLGGEVRDTIYDNIQLPAIIATYRIPAMGTKDYYAAYMFAQLLAGGKSSRMNKSLVDDKQLALFVASFPYPLEDPGVHLMFAIANMGKDPGEVEKAMDEEIEKVKTEPISDKEFQKLRNMIEAEFVDNSVKMVSIAENLANYKMYYGDTNLINTELDRFMNVTKEDIQNVAKKYFNKDNRVVLFYLPKK
ncbi:MAG TPA: insulinase family protein [Bacteroidetes bacterium]|nr:insulinase family protein [Bacteroidota bacterium]